MSSVARWRPRCARTRQSTRARAREERAALAQGKAEPCRTRARKAIWAVDAGVSRSGTWAWALVDPQLSTVATGHLTPSECNAKDSNAAEALAVLHATAHLPHGARLTTDALSVIDAVIRAERKGGNGTAARIVAALAERRGTIEWRPRFDVGISAADAAGRKAAAKPRRWWERWFKPPRNGHERE